MTTSASPFTGSSRRALVLDGVEHGAGAVAQRVLAAGAAVAAHELGVGRFEEQDAHDVAGLPEPARRRR